MSTYPHLQNVLVRFEQLASFILAETSVAVLGRTEDVVREMLSLSLNKM